MRQTHASLCCPWPDRPFLIMGFFSGLLKSVTGGDVLGAASGIAGGMFQQSSAKAAAAKQMQFQKDSYQHRYQWQMDDMRKAGLNPILAYSQGPPGGPAGASYTPQNIGASGVAGAVGGATSGYTVSKKKTEDKMRDATLDQLHAQAQATRAGAVKTAEETLNTRAARAVIQQNFRMNIPNVTSAGALNQYLLTKGGRYGVQAEAAGMPAWTGGFAGELETGLQSPKRQLPTPLPMANG